MSERTWYLIIVALFGVVLAVVVFGFAVSVAAETGVDIPLERIHRGDPGERFLEADIAATNELGWTCGATLDRRNNESTHQGTNVIIESGANTVVFSNVESEAFDEATKAFVIDGDILVYTQVGEDGVSSMGFLLSFECFPPPDETTTTTVPGTTTTTEPPPINGPETGGGACADGACADWNPVWRWLFPVGITLVGVGGAIYAGSRRP